jgi:LAS superfamily LD-carboxypeptidase LdcB
MTIDELKHQIFVGVVEDNKDPKRLCRAKIRVFNVFDDIPVEDMPWAVPWKDLSGHEADIPEIGKVVSVVFDEGNPYKPEYIRADHFNINLENKLKAISEEDYLSFSSLMFDHSTQLFVSKSTGLKLDHEYTNINLDSNGNINLNLRDGNSKVLIGSPDSAQAAVLGTSFMAWMDTLVDNLLGANGGPYLGNLGAPVIANPALIQCLLEYKASRTPKFLSDRVWIVNNLEVKKQTREYIDQEGDKWKSTVRPNDFVKTKTSAYTPEDSPESGRAEITDPSVPNDIQSETIGAEANIKTVNVSNYDNGRIPNNKMKKNKYLSKSLRGDSTYLMAEASDALDKLMDLFDKTNFPGKQKISFTDGYRSYARQEALYEKYGAGRAAKPGTSNHGWGIAVDMYWGVRTSMFKDSDARPSGFKHPNYVWMLENGKNFGWYNPVALRDDSRTDEWWHWEYHGKPKPVEIKAARYKGEFTQADIDTIKRFGGVYRA